MKESGVGVLKIEELELELLCTDSTALVIITKISLCGCLVHVSCDVNAFFSVSTQPL
jgi:hypothetical protein